MWATDAEVMATASLLGCDIVVNTKVGETMQWLPYSGGFSLWQFTEQALYQQNVSDHFNVVINA